MKKYWIVTLLVGSFLNVSAVAEDESAHTEVKQTIKLAIEKFEQTNLKQWAFKLDKYENEEGDVTSSIERHSPNKDISKRWQLLQINGEKPTEKQIKKFIDKKTSSAKKKKNKSSHQIELRDIIDEENLQLIEESAEYLKVSFPVYLERLGDNARGKLRGSLNYKKDGQYIEEIHIVNTDEFSPVFSAKITDLSLTFSFIHINDTVLPHQQKLNMKGSFAYFTEIDEVSTDTYSNFQFNGM